MGFTEQNGSRETNRDHEGSKEGECEKLHGQTGRRNSMTRLAGDDETNRYINIKTNNR